MTTKDLDELLTDVTERADVDWLRRYEAMCESLIDERPYDTLRARLLFAHIQKISARIIFLETGEELNDVYQS